MFSTVAQITHNFLDFTECFCCLAVTCPYDDETLKSLFWIGANFHHAVQLPDNTALTWKEVIIRYLESILTQSPKHHLRSWSTHARPPQRESYHPPRSGSQSPRKRGQRQPLPQNWSSMSDQGLRPTTSVDEGRASMENED